MEIIVELDLCLRRIEKGFPVRFQNIGLLGLFGKDVFIGVFIPFPNAVLIYFQHTPLVLCHMILDPGIKIHFH